jgi:YfiH family protein
VTAPAQPSGIEVLTPAWAAPARVRAAFTLRGGGVSAPPFDTLNLGTHVGDAVGAVTENRRRVRAQLDLPSEPAWIEQVHGTRVADLDVVAGSATPADAMLTRRAGTVCVVQVADCLPVLFAAADGSAVGAAHAGWRGLAAGVLETTVARLGNDPQRLLAWLGPAIGAEHFEVGEEVRTAFTTRDAHSAAAFTRNSRGRWQCDLIALAHRRLAAAGVRNISGGSWCTYTDRVRFFSYRRDGQCGRMAALVWLHG